MLENGADLRTIQTLLGRANDLRRRNLYARRDKEIEDRAQQHTSAGVIITAGRSSTPGGGRLYICLF